MQAYLEIKAWPDALSALQSLRHAGVRMAFLSNFTAPMLDAAVKNSGLEEFSTSSQHRQSRRVQTRSSCLSNGDRRIWLEA